MFVIESEQPDGAWRICQWGDGETGERQDAVYETQSVAQAVANAMAPYSRGRLRVRAASET